MNELTSNEIVKLIKKSKGRDIKFLKNKDEFDMAIKY